MIYLCDTCILLVHGKYKGLPFYTRFVFGLEKGYKNSKRLPFRVFTVEAAFFCEKYFLNFRC